MPGVRKRARQASALRTDRGYPPMAARCAARADDAEPGRYLKLTGGRPSSPVE